MLTHQFYNGFYGNAYGNANGMVYGDSHSRVRHQDRYPSGRLDRDGQPAEEFDTKRMGAASGVTYGMRAGYAEDSTEADPIVQIVSDYGGEYTYYKVHINQVNPQNATPAEMFALCSYADDKGIGSAGAFGSWQKLCYYEENAEYKGYVEGPAGHFGSKLDWEDIVRAMMKDYLEGGLYKEYQDGAKLLQLFEKMAMMAMG